MRRLLVRQELPLLDQHHSACLFTDRNISEDRSRRRSFRLLWESSELPLQIIAAVTACPRKQTNKKHLEPFQQLPVRHHSVCETGNAPGFLVTPDTRSCPCLMLSELIFSFDFLLVVERLGTLNVKFQANFEKHICDCWNRSSLLLVQYGEQTAETMKLITFTYGMSCWSSGRLRVNKTHSESR